MSTSKALNNKLALKLATDSRHKFLKNGVVKKLSSDGKFREVGTTRHGYNVITYKGKKIVVARAIAARKYLELGYTPETAIVLLTKRVIVRRNGVSLDDRIKNLVDLYPSRVPREEGTRRLSRKQIDRMVELFCDGFSVAKIARRFRRRISRSHVSRVIRRELGIETVGA